LQQNNRASGGEGNGISAAQLHRLIDSNAFGVIASTSSGAIRESNDAFLEMIGYTRRQLQAGEIDWRSLTPSEWRSSDDNAVSEMESTGIVSPYKKEYIHRDGHRVPILLSGARMAGTRDEKICCIVDLSTILVPENECAAAARQPAAGWINPQAALRSARERFGLTNREFEVLNALVNGKTNVQIAADLLIAPATASEHVLHVLRKVGVQNRTQLFAKIFLQDDSQHSG
jgi:PAS domain S-box-containing protein